MNQVKITHVLLAALAPLFLFCLVVSVQQSLKFSELNLTGVVIFIYYIIPVLLFTLSFVFFVKRLGGMMLGHFNFIQQLVISLVLGLVFSLGWTILGFPRKSTDMSYVSYWLEMVKQNSLFLLYFVLLVPATFWIAKKIDLLK